MLRKILSVLLGLVVASATMMLCEFINSLFFPLPEGLDIYDTEAVWALTQSLPWVAFILVLLGWMLGSFLAGLVVRKVSKSKSVGPAWALAALLTFFAAVNVWMLHHPLWVVIIGLPQFGLMVRWGWKAGK